MVTVRFVTSLGANLHPDWRRNYPYQCKHEGLTLCRCDDKRCNLVFSFFFFFRYPQPPALQSGGQPSEFTRRYYYHITILSWIYHSPTEKCFIPLTPFKFPTHLRKAGIVQNQHQHHVLEHAQKLLAGGTINSDPRTTDCWIAFIVTETQKN